MSLVSSALGFFYPGQTSITLGSPKTEKLSSNPDLFRMEWTFPGPWTPEMKTIAQANVGVGDRFVMVAEGQQTTDTYAIRVASRVNATQAQLAAAAAAVKGATAASSEKIVNETKADLFAGVEKFLLYGGGGASIGGAAIAVVPPMLGGAFQPMGLVLLVIGVFMLIAWFIISRLKHAIPSFLV